MYNFTKETNMKNNLKRLLAMILALTMLSSAALAESFSAIVTSDRMTVYSDEGLFEEAGSLKKNSVVTVVDSEDGVVKFNYKGKTGYASVSDLNAVENVGRAAIVTETARVYKSANKASKSTKVSKGTELYVLSTSGKWAAVERNGNVGFMLLKYLTPADAADESADSTEDNDTTVADGNVVTCEFQAEVAVKKLTVYASGSTKSKKLGTMSKGTVVTVLAYNKTWAYIELDGHRGHVKHSGLSKVTEDTAVKEETASNDTAKAESESSAAETTGSKLTTDYSNSKYTNEQLIYAFLINECGFNSAAACGVLANIRAESNFNPSALNSIGCYGICQWYKGRRTRLEAYCQEHSYDSASLVGQLWYLKYELETHYKGTWNYLRSVENTAQGAYDAGYYWCYHFEVPENRTNNSIKRGNSAQDTYWSKYN